MNRRERVILEVNQRAMEEARIIDAVSIEWAIDAYESALRKDTLEDPELVKRAITAETGWAQLSDIGDPYFRSLYGEIVQNAILAALELEPKP
jgi:succinylarginine dihydrolase